MWVFESSSSKWKNAQFFGWTFCGRSFFFRIKIIEMNYDNNEKNMISKQWFCILIFKTCRNHSIDCISFITVDLTIVNFLSWNDTRAKRTNESILWKRKKKSHWIEMKEKREKIKSLWRNERVSQIYRHTKQRISIRRQREKEGENAGDENLQLV